MSRKRPLTKSELDLWRRATADVQPLADMPKSKAPLEPAPKTKSLGVSERRQTASSPRITAQRPATPTTRPRPHARPLDPTSPVDIDRRNWERLKRGQITIERTLDLHGRTQIEAHGLLDRFLTMAVTTGLRCVLVVTGKGSGGDGRGILRQMVPRWLAETTHRQNVLTYCPAQPRHGGDGALYVLLRRQRGGERR